MNRRAEINNLKIIVGDFNNPISIMDKTTREKMKKEREDLNNTVNYLHLTKIFIKLSNQQQNTHFYHLYMK